MAETQQTWIRRCLRRTVSAAVGKAALACMVAMGLWGSAHAGWNAYTNGDAGFNAPTSYANQRTIEFSTSTPITTTANNTLTTEQTAGRLTFSNTNASGGSFTQTDTGAADGMSGKHVQITSGTSTSASSLTIDFTSGGTHGGTSYVAFDWYLGLKDADGAYVVFTFSDGTSQTLYSCSTVSTSTCIGAYVPSNFLTNLFNALTLCLFGCNQYDTVYLTYVPSTGVKINSVSFYVKRCDGCGFLGSNSSQDMYVDNITYVDPTVAPHHLELTTPSATVNAGSNTTFTVKSCANAACSLLYTTGMSGTLTLSGAGMTASYPSGQTYSIGARSSSGTLAASVSPAGGGTATVALSAPSIAPTGSPAVYCGIGVAAASGNACTLTVVGLHHLEVTATASSATTGTAVTYTIKACADAACTVLFTGGVTGNLTVSGLGLVVSYSSAAGAFVIGASGSTSLQATIVGIGTATVSLSGISPTATASPAYYCGLGQAAASGNSCAFVSTLLMHHLEVTTSSGVGITCQPTTYTIKACADAACSTLFTSGVTGTVTVSGPSSVNYPSGQSFAIGSGSSSTTFTAWATSPGTATVGLSSVSPVATNALKPVFCGMGVAANSTNACNITVDTAALLFDVPHHIADAVKNVSVRAVKASESDPTVCVPAFGTGTAVNKDVVFKCAYTNPATSPPGVGVPKRVKVGGVSLPQCGDNAYGSNGTVTLAFTNGTATTTVQYADVGQMTMAATYTGSGSDAGLSMTGTDIFIAAPSAVTVTSLPGSYVAGTAFAPVLTVTNASGGATPNFGRESTPETITTSWTQTAPSVGAVVAGTFSGTGVVAGIAAGTKTLALSWDEVGAGTLTAVLTSTNYLSSGQAITNFSQAIGPFRPSYLDVAVTQGCGAFTYSGQPFTVVLTARNSANAVTKNYYGPNGQARDVTLNGALGGGAFTGGNPKVLSTSFVAGTTAAIGRTFEFGTKLTSPGSLTVGAVDDDGVTSPAVPASTQSVSLRSGRLKLFNFFGSEKTQLAVPMQTQYWTGSAWVINSADSCTTFPMNAVALSNYVSYKGAAAGWVTNPTGMSFSGGNGALTLSAPSVAGSVGSVDVAINLGSTGTDQSCLPNHPATTGAQKPWLRAQNGSTNGCTGVVTYDRDPSARATFGVYQPESNRTVFTRELY